MKVFSNSVSGNNIRRTGNTEVFASVGDKSLVLVNGRPVQVDAHVALNTEQSYQVAVSTDKILAQAGLEKTSTNQSIVETLREYGVALTSENLKQAAAFAKTLPGFAADKLNLATIALMILKGIDQKNAALIKEYIAGKFEFAEILKNIPPQLLAELKGNWQSGRLFARIQNLISDQGAARFFSEDTDILEELVGSLKLQEVLSSAEGQKRENTFYFQWPVFWSDRDLPDTLEGEAFYGDPDEQGFCLRLLFEPPSLGSVEVALNSISEKLWVHFGCDTEVISDIKSIFPVLHESLLAQGFKEVRITIGKIRNLNNFFQAVGKNNLLKQQTDSKKIDLRI